ncbi:HlyD family efflux transporter periplasmic adaptor subunit [Fulvivirga sp. 1062]|uniref:HlyD family efflux transporter periplasmic adaptor subunit n=2 Tax=Fulvivirga sedimenti TaxID=2879465 RepID=A0A9X1HXB0_9BACT|nr:HlyD family efflux transporter periplasmic adaptor subunit [Fulvivirga sedimenti]
MILLPVLLMASCGTDNSGIKPEKVAITESVYASLTIQPDSMYQAYAVVSGIVEQNLVEEGDLVRVDDPLVKIRNDAPELNLANARLALEQARDDLQGRNNALADLENQIETMRLQQRDDSLNFERQRRLWEQKIGTQTEFERRKLAYQLSSNQLTNLKVAYRRLRQDLEIRYQQAMNNYEVARVNTGDYTVRSKIDGKVYALQKEPGETVSMQEPVAMIGSASRFMIEMLIDERDIARIRSGQEVLISLEAFDNAVFQAKVIKIYPQKNERNQTFKVEAQFEKDAPAVLYAGLSGEANIVIDQKEAALTIPLDYLSENSTVLTDSGEIPVTTGLRSLDRVEILEGINSETLIYKPE